MKISEVGEFGLIDRIREIIAIDRADIVTGIGDDVAVLDTGAPELLLATVDCQIDGVHFLSASATAAQIGRRALAINLSDIAAMGGHPDYALVSLSLPFETDVEWVEDLYRGFREEAARSGTAIIGGNMARSPGALQLHVTVLGRVKREHLLLRSGAKPGEAVLVTGALGESTGGLQLLLSPSLDLPPADRERLLARYNTPTPRLRESAAIAHLGVATSMLDISDGLSSDVGHICESSGVGVRVEAARLPIPEVVRRLGALCGRDPVDLALCGGEDFELILTAPRNAVDRIIATVRESTGTDVTVVGEIVDAREGRTLVHPDGREEPLVARGWNHFEK
ncbi:MAG: thiamine-phosphate kinase [Thermoanaerobaculia bacterium]